MMHHHLLIALRAQFDYYLAPAHRAEWLAFFPEMEPAYVGGILDEISADPPSLRPHASAGSATLPLIVARLQNSRVTQRPLGHSAGGEETQITEHSCQLEILAKTEELALVLAVSVLKMAHNLRVDFLKNNYSYYEVQGFDPLSPQEALASEELGVFVRRLDLKGQSLDASIAVASDPTLGTLTLGLIPDGRVGFI